MCISIAPCPRPIAIVNPDDSSYEGEISEDRRVRTSLFTQLPKTFSLEDVQKVYERNGKSRDRETILENIRNWKRGGKVSEVEAKKLWTKIGVAI